VPFDTLAAEPTHKSMEPKPKKLLEQVREVMRLQHYAYRTEETYIQWIKRYILFHHKRHPREMGRDEIEAFLTDLAVNQQVAAATQNQALNAILFLYQKVLGIEITGINAVRANAPRNLPVVLTPAEALAVIQQMDAPHQLVVKLLYGSGLRLSEALRLRVKDVDFAQHQIIVRDGKGRKNRVTMLPTSAAAEIKDHLVGIRRQHQQDLGRGFGSVYLPFALKRKYPNANRDWIWQYVFPAGRIVKDPRSGEMRRQFIPTYSTGVDGVCGAPSMPRAPDSSKALRLTRQQFFFMF
jgi:integron integrase